MEELMKKTIFDNLNYEITININNFLENSNFSNTLQIILLLSILMENIEQAYRILLFIYGWYGWEINNYVEEGEIEEREEMIEGTPDMHFLEDLHYDLSDLIDDYDDTDENMRKWYTPDKIDEVIVNIKQNVNDIIDNLFRTIPQEFTPEMRVYSYYMNQINLPPEYQLNGEVGNVPYEYQIEYEKMLIKYAIQTFTNLRFQYMKKMTVSTKEFPYNMTWYIYDIQDEPIENVPNMLQLTVPPNDKKRKLDEIEATGYDTEGHTSGEENDDEDDDNQQSQKRGRYTGGVRFGRKNKRTHKKNTYHKKTRRHNKRKKSPSMLRTRWYYKKNNKTNKKITKT